MGVIALKEDQRTVYWNNKTKEKIITVPYGENAYSALAAFLKLTRVLMYCNQSTTAYSKNHPYNSC